MRTEIALYLGFLAGMKPPTVLWQYAVVSGTNIGIQNGQ